MLHHLTFKHGDERTQLPSLLPLLLLLRILLLPFLLLFMLLVLLLLFCLMSLHCMRLSNKYTINDTLTQTSREVEHTHTHSYRHALMQAHTHTHTHTPPTRLARNLWTSQVFWVCGLLTHLSEFKWLKGCLEFSQCESERTDTPCACLPSPPPLPPRLLPTPLFTRITITVIQPPIPHTQHCHTWNALSAFGFTLTLFGRKARYADGRRNTWRLRGVTCFHCVATMNTVDILFDIFFD